MAIVSRMMRNHGWNTMPSEYRWWCHRPGECISPKNMEHRSNQNWSGCPVAAMKKIILFEVAICFPNVALCAFMTCSIWCLLDIGETVHVHVHVALSAFMTYSIWCFLDIGKTVHVHIHVALSAFMSCSILLSCHKHHMLECVFCFMHCKKHYVPPLLAAWPPLLAALLQLGIF